MADWTMKAHDLYPSIQAILTSGGVAVDLTPAVGVKFIMVNNPGGTVIVNRAATITNPTAGIVTYAWISGDTATPGNYQAEWEVTWAGGKQTFPTLSYHTISILADLDGA